jgi:O-antigen/teichoic acid export membrane protein
MAKLGSPAIVGQYALALAITAPIFIFTNLQLRAVQATDALNEYTFANYFTLRFFSTLLGVLVVGIVVALAHYDRTTSLIILLVGAAKAIETFSDIIAGHLQKFERLDQVARALMLRGLTSVTTFTFTFWITRQLVAAVMALALTWLVVIGVYDFRVLSKVLRERIFFHYSWSALRRLAWLSLPLAFALAVFNLNVNIPRYLLERKLGAAELGIFASIAYLMTALYLIASALSQSVSTRLSRLLVNNNVNRFSMLLRKLIGLSLVFGILTLMGSITFGKQVLIIVYRVEYARHVDLLIVLVITATISTAASFFSVGMIAARCVRPQILIAITSALTATWLTLTLLPSFGLMAAGYGLLGSSLMQCVANYYVLRSAITKAYVSTEATCRIAEPR